MAVPHLHHARDSALIARARQGEAGAFDALAGRYRDLLYRLALLRLGEPEAALDCVQETLLRAYESLPRFRGASSFSLWLRGILENVCAEESRKRARWARTSSLLAPAEGGEAHAAVERREEAVEALGAIAQLPMTLRTTALLSLVEELEHAEVSALLGIGVEAVRMRLSRARALLMAVPGRDEKAESVRGSLAAGYHHLGVLLLRQGREEASDRARRRGVEFAPDTVYSLWAGVQQARGTPQQMPAQAQALRILEQAVVQRPEAPRATVALGNMRYWEQHDYPEAERLFLSVRYHPGVPGWMARQALAHLYTHVGRPKEAAELLAGLLAELGDTWPYVPVLQARALLLCQDPAAPQYLVRAKAVSLRGHPGAPSDRMTRIHTGNIRALVSDLLSRRGDAKGAARFSRAARRAYPADYREAPLV